jgi:FkbM family methyltransferase
MIFYSQADQDKWVAEFYKYKKNGYFIEVGAYDGIQTSNTYFLEKELNWSGVCIEANRQVFNSLAANRKSKNINIAVSSKKGYCNFLGDKISDKGGDTIECDTLNNILLDNYIGNNIDYLSLDIEGAEYIALESLNFNYWDIGLITVEHNLYCTDSIEKDKIYNLLTNNGFYRAIEDVKCLDKNPLYYNKPYEDWYISNKYIV